MKNDFSELQVTARERFLVDVASKPMQYADDQATCAALTTQGNLAKLSLSEYGIVSMALNTLKAYADDVSPESWTKLDALRLHALDRMNAASKQGEAPRRGTKLDLQNQVTTLTGERDNALEDLEVLTSVLYRAMRNARNYAKDSGRGDLIHRCTQDEVELRAMLSVLHSKPGDKA